MDAIRLLAIDDLELADVGIDPARETLVTNESEFLGFGVRRREGTAASVFFGGSAEPARWRVVIQNPNAAARGAVLAALGADPTEERRLRLQREDALRSTVVGRAAVTKVETPNDLDLYVDFEGQDSVWEDEEATVTGKSFTTALDRAMAVAVPGNARTAPSVRVRPLAQRTSRTAAVGWSWRRRYAVTNGSDEPLFRYPVRISLGSTTALVSGGKALSSGNDVRVWLHGIEQERTLVSWNSSASHAWVIVPVLPPGESLTFDVVYGNASAGTPPVLAYPNLPAFELATSTNALWVYSVSQTSGNAGKGLWHLSRGTGGPVVDFSVPGAWRPTSTFENPDFGEDDDKRSQVRTAAFGVGGTVYHVATFAAQRSPAGSLFASYDNGLDGVAVHNPFGIASVRTDLRWENVLGIGQLVIAARGSAAEPWSAFYADATSTTSATDGSGTPSDIATATYAPGAGTKHLALAVWPANGQSMLEPETPDFRGAAGSMRTVCELAIDSAGLGIALATAEEQVYELATELRLGGGAAPTPPYRALLVGNARGQTGAGTPRCAVRLDQTLAIDAAARTHVVWATAAPGVAVETVPTHAVRAVTAWSDGALVVESPVSEWLTLSPPRTSVPNGDFGADDGSWRLGTPTAGMTVAKSWDASIGGVVNGSLKLAVTPNVAGVGASAEVVNHKAFAVNGRPNADAAAWVRTSSANLRPRLVLAWYDGDGNALGTVVEPDWTPVANAEYRRVVGGAAPDGAVTFRVGVRVVAATAGATGNVWVDDVDVNGNELVVTDVALGALAIEASVRGRWL